MAMKEVNERMVTRLRKKKNKTKSLMVAILCQKIFTLENILYNCKEIKGREIKRFDLS